MSIDFQDISHTEPRGRGSYAANPLEPPSTAIPVRTLRELRRNEYIVFEWNEITLEGDLERRFIPGRMRTPAEAYQAAQEFDVFLDNARPFFRQAAAAK